jgi:hypothetical protein
MPPNRWCRDALCFCLGVFVTSFFSLQQQLQPCLTDCDRRSLENFNTVLIESATKLVESARRLTSPRNESSAITPPAALPVKELNDVVPQPPKLFAAGTKPALHVHRSPPELLWLLIGIGTVPRAKDEPYLTRVLEELSRQLPPPPDPLHGRIKVLVRSSKPRHVVFDRAAALYDGDARFDFSRGVTSRRASLATAGVPTNSSSLARRRILGIEAQTLDVVALLIEAQRRPAAYFMFVEDDFLPCANALLGVWHLIQRANEVGSSAWSALRVSYGLNGIVIKSADGPSVAAHFRRGGEAPDHLFTDWALASGRKVPFLAFRHNLFYHLGTRSAVGNSADRFAPACYELLHDWLAGEERFDVSRCPHDSVSPCPPPQQRPGHHLSRSPKTGKPFPCAISLQDRSALFESRRFQACTSAAPDAPGAAPAARRPPPVAKTLQSAAPEADVVAPTLGRLGE